MVTLTILSIKPSKQCMVKNVFSRNGINKHIINV